MRSSSATDGANFSSKTNCRGFQNHLSRYTMPGNPTIATGSPLTLTGFRDGVDGLYHVKSVTHTLDGGGYKTTCECEV